MIFAYCHVIYYVYTDSYNAAYPTSGKEKADSAKSREGIVIISKPWKLLHHYHTKLYKTHCQSVQIWPYKATGIASPLQIQWCPHCVSMVCTNSTEV